MDELSARRLRNVIPVLVEQRNILIAGGVSFAGHLVDLAIMQLRLTLHEISEVAARRIQIRVTGRKGE